MRDRDIYDAIGTLHGFGTSSLSITEAAEIITLDMWYSGYIANATLKEQADNIFQDELSRQLSKEKIKIEIKLARSVEIGNLKAERVRRDLLGNVIHWKTYINDEILRVWVEEHGVKLGDFWNYDYMEGRARMCNFIVQEAVKLRLARDAGTNIFDEVMHAGEMADSNNLDNVEPRSFRGLYAAWASLVEENKALRIQLEPDEVNATSDSDQLVTPRIMHSLLTIIAALCSKAGIDTKVRGAAGRIAREVEKMEEPISEETIKKYLDKLNDTISTRTR